jgi:hypothetical protein
VGASVSYSASAASRFAALKEIGEYVLLGHRHAPRDLAEVVARLPLPEPRAATPDLTDTQVIEHTRMRVWLRSDNARIVQVISADDVNEFVFVPGPAERAG